MEERVYGNSNENLARKVTGLETNAKHFVINGESADKLLENERKAKFNDQVEEYVQRFDKYKEMVKSVQEEICKDVNHLEIKPLGNYVIVQAYPQNPFQKMQVSDSGIILDTGGLAPLYKSNETGEVEEEEEFVKTGIVMEVGPECKYAQVGDTVFWTKVSETPIPFFRQGFLLVNETRIMAIVNDNFNERKIYNKE